MSSDWIAGRVLTPSLEEVIDSSLRPAVPTWAPTARFGYPLKGVRDVRLRPGEAGAGPRRRAGRRGGRWSGSTEAAAATFRVADPISKKAAYETVGY